MEPAVLRDHVMEPTALCEWKAQDFAPCCARSTAKELPAPCASHKNRNVPLLRDECELRRRSHSQNDSRPTELRVRCGLHGQGDVVVGADAGRRGSANERFGSAGVGDLPRPSLLCERCFVLESELKQVATRSDDLPDYATAFKASSDRARYAFYVVIIATVLIFITNYNVQEDSWPLRRIDFWFGSQNTAARAPAPGGAQETLEEQKTRLMREEYLRQFASRSVFAESPIPGVSIDVNDLGIVGGVALSLLMLILAICIVREHENLYLALYKVRMLCIEEGPRCSDGQSRANLLYHSLAMSQVLSSPPTLARWQQRGVLHHFGILFFAPAGVYVWVVITDFLTRERGESYGRSVTAQLVFEVIVFIAITLLSCVAWLHTRAMAKRWRRAFFRVNRRRLLVNQMGLHEWLKLWPRKYDKLRSDAALATMLVDTLTTVETTPAHETSLFSITEKIKGRSANRTEVRDLTDKVMNRGKELAEADCSSAGRKFDRLLEFAPTMNRIEAGEWVVAGAWKYSVIHDSE